MIRAAALASGDGEKLQAVLDAMYFGELPDFELSAVICPEKNAYVMQRALRRTWTSSWCCSSTTTCRWA